MAKTKKGIIATDMLLFVVVALLIFFVIYMVYRAVAGEGPPTSSNAFFWFWDTVQGIVST